MGSKRKRKIAAHRVYDCRRGEMYSFCVVEREETGEVHLSFLQQERQFTEWFPGLIVLSNDPVELYPDETVSVFLSRLCVGKLGKDSFSENSVRAYWMTPFRVADMAFLPKTKVVRLW